MRTKRDSDPLAQDAGRLGLTILHGLGAGRRHPRTTDRLRAFLAKVSVPVLVAEFLVIAAVFASMLALAYVITDPGGATPGFLEWWKELFLYVLSFPPDKTLAPNVEAGRGVLQMIAAIAGLVLPALFVGAVVLKLFISPDLFTMRNKVTVLANAPDDPRLAAGEHHVAVRGYSSTPFRLLGVTFSAILRFETTDSDGNALLLHRQLRVGNPDYAIAHPHVPYTLTIPIDREDWKDETGGDLARLQGFPLGSEAVLIVLISGRIPELSSDFTEAHDYPLEDSLSRAPYTGLTIDYERRAIDWDGWQDFDER